MWFLQIKKDKKPLFHLQAIIVATHSARPFYLTYIDMY